MATASQASRCLSMSERHRGSSRSRSASGNAPGADDANSSMVQSGVGVIVSVLVSGVVPTTVLREVGGGNAGQVRRR